MKKILLSLIMLVAVSEMMMQPVLASSTCGEGCVETSILGENHCSCGNDGVEKILKWVINIFSALVGILGVVGIIIVGIQYLTAGGNEEKTKKARQRLLDIIIGLAVFVVLYGLLMWLLPGFENIGMEKEDVIVAINL